jgi:hypothetical protein
MPITMYASSVPVFERRLKALDAILDKAAAYAEARKIDPAVLVGARLYPDMFALARQVQIATDHAKGAGARLAGLPVPSYEDSEKTFAELKARIAKTLVFLATLEPEQINGSEARDIKVRAGPREYEFKGEDYLLNFALPNFYFHMSMAYAILRHNGVELGKQDYLA